MRSDREIRSSHSRTSHARTPRLRVHPPRIAWLPLVAGAMLAFVAPAATQEAAYPDSNSVHGRARALQASFERTRVRNLPSTHSGSGGRCDEVIGRLCIWDSGDDSWTPKPEAPVIVEKRREMIRALDSLGTIIPGDRWILGQRVRYRIEDGRLREAAEVARECGPSETWRCHAYVGLALHQAEDIVAAEAAFAAALAEMPVTERVEWTDLRPLMDSELKDWLDDQPDSSEAAERLWRLADPLFLAPGNDRWTGHLSRWAYAMSSERTRSPHQLSWGKDLTESVVRYGWSVAWERPWPRPGEALGTSAIGHDPPAALRLYPTRLDVEGPSNEADWVKWRLDRKGMRTLYLPPYLDSLASMDAQIGHFRFPGGVRFVAAGKVGFDGFAERLAGAEGALYFEDIPGVRASGQGLVDADGGVRLEVAVDEPDAVGVLSLELLLPEWRRAQRARYSVRVPSVPPDVLAVSDVVVLESDREAESASEVAAALRPSLVVRPDETLRIAFEVYGLGYRVEGIDFRVWLEEVGRGFFSRATRWLGFGSEEDRIAVSWTEPGPSAPRALFRSLDLSIPGLEVGEYDVVVSVQTRGRPAAERRRRIRVAEHSAPR